MYRECHRQKYTLVHYILNSLQSIKHKIKIYIVRCVNWIMLEYSLSLSLFFSSITHYNVLKP